MQGDYSEKSCLSENDNECVCQICGNCGCYDCDADCDCEALQPHISATLATLVASRVPSIIIDIKLHRRFGDAWFNSPLREKFEKEKLYAR